MSESDERRGDKRTAIVMRMKMRYPDVDVFVEKFAINLSRGGVFIATRSPKPVGTQLRFDLKIADETTVLGGLGIVRWIRPFDPAAPKGPHGMGLEFLEIEESSRAIIERVLQFRRQAGMPEELTQRPEDEAASAASPQEPPAHQTAPKPSADQAPAEPPPAASPAAKQAVAPPVEQPAPPSASQAAPAGPPRQSPANSSDDLDNALTQLLDRPLDETLLRARTIAKSEISAVPSGVLDQLLGDRPHGAAALPLQPPSDELVAAGTEPPSDDLSEPPPVAFPDGETTLVASKKGARMLADDEQLADALDKLELSDDGSPPAITGPIVMPTPTDDQLEEALSEIDDDDFIIDEEPSRFDRPSPAHVSEFKEMESSIVLPESDADFDFAGDSETIAKPLGTEALSPDEIDNQIEEIEESSSRRTSFVKTAPVTGDSIDIVIDDDDDDD